MNIGEWIFAIIQTVTVVLIAVYVIYTALTFKQIKEQTDFAVKAALKNRFVYPNKLPRHKRIWDRQIQNLIISWRDTVSKMYADDFDKLEDKYCLLQLSNRGKTDIDEIILKLRIEIYKFPSSNLLIEPTDINIEITLQADIEPSSEVYFSLFNYRYFPIHRVTILEASYKDIKNQSYDGIYGDKTTNEKENYALDPDFDF